MGIVPREAAAAAVHSQLRGNIPDAVDICLSSTDDYSYNKSTLPIALFRGSKSPFIPHETPLKTLSCIPRIWPGRWARTGDLIGTTAAVEQISPWWRTKLDNFKNLWQTNFRPFRIRLGSERNASYGIASQPASSSPS